MRMVLLSEWQVVQIMKELDMELYVSGASKKINNDIMLLAFREEGISGIECVIKVGFSGRC